MPRITQRELARQLGVSQQAVSFALNGSGTLSAQTRERIIGEAAKLGYRPNTAARSMLKGRMGNAALICNESFKSYLPASLIAGTHHALEKLNHHLLIHTLSLDKLNNPDYVPTIMSELAVDGFIIILEGKGERRLRQWLRQYDIPAVWVNRKEPVNCVHPDDFHLSYRAARKLIDTGHRRIAYLGQEIREDSHYSVGDRLEGYRSAMREAGLDERAYFLPHAFRAEARPTELGSNAAFDFLEKDPPSACYGYGHTEIEALFIEALARGVRVPHDLSLILIGDAMARLGTIKIDVLRLPFYWVGVHAVEMLEQRISRSRDLDSRAVRNVEFDRGDTLAEA